VQTTLWNIRIQKELHRALLRANQNRMVDLRRSVFEASANIALFQECIVGENLGVTCAARQHVQNVLHPEPIVTDARTPTALFGIEGDPEEFASHSSSLPQAGGEAN
jgi:hypothetical protein